jgi:hypothetical protein
MLGVDQPPISTHQDLRRKIDAMERYDARFQAVIRHHSADAGNANSDEKSHRISRKICSSHKV